VVWGSSWTPFGDHNNPPFAVLMAASDSNCPRCHLLCENEHTFVIQPYHVFPAIRTAISWTSRTSAPGTLQRRRRHPAEELRSDTANLDRLTHCAAACILRNTATSHADHSPAAPAVPDPNFLAFYNSSRRCPSEIAQVPGRRTIICFPQALPAGSPHRSVSKSNRCLLRLLYGLSQAPAPRAT